MTEVIQGMGELYVGMTVRHKNYSLEVCRQWLLLAFIVSEGSFSGHVVDSKHTCFVEKHSK